MCSVFAVLSIAEGPEAPYGERKCADMLAIAQTIIHEGHRFVGAEIVKQFLEPGLMYASA